MQREARGRGGLAEGAGAERLRVAYSGILSASLSVTEYARTLLLAGKSAVPAKSTSGSDSRNGPCAQFLHGGTRGKQFALVATKHLPAQTPIGVYAAKVVEDTANEEEDIMNAFFESARRLKQLLKRTIPKHNQKEKTSIA